MLRVGLAALMAATGTGALAQQTDFGIRAVGNVGTVEPVPTIGPEPTRAFASARQIDLPSVARLGAQWGRVTSTYRSWAHNKRVGGVPNSYHLRGRAIDIARRPGVHHAQIAAAYRNAGYNLVESLDEGDHSHFAFGGPGDFSRAPRAKFTTASVAGKTEWRIVYVSSSGGD